MEPTEVTFNPTRGEELQRKGAKAAAVDGRFWIAPLSDGDAPPPDLSAQVMDWAETLWAAWRRLRQHDRKCDVIYENRPLKVGGKFHVGVRSLEMAGLGAAELMVSTAIVDTFDARFSKRKNMPMFVVDDAEWDLKNQAQEFRRWLHGKLVEADFEKVYGECVTDMLVRGDGMAYIDEGDDDVFIERVHRSEILIDPWEAKQGEAAVRTMYRFRTVSRDSLIARFPEYKAEILGAPDAPDRDEHYTSDWMASESKVGRRDVVDFVEAWHLPHRSCDPGEDGGGRVVRCLAGKTLCYEEWKSPRFPIARLSYKKPRRGFWSMGLIDVLEPAQRQINRMVADVAMNVAVTGKGIWMVQGQFDIPVEKLSGYRPFKVTYQGPREPAFVHPSPISPTTLELLRQKIAWAHEMVGAAQWSVQGKSPLGAGASGIAIDTMEDLLSDRHSKAEENCSLFRLDASQCLLDAAGRVAARREDEEYEEPDDDERDERDDDDAGGDAKPSKGRKKTRKRAYYATWMDKGVLEQLDWNQVAMQREQYRLQLEPTSFLPHTRAGKLAAAAELIKTGVIGQDKAATLFDEPDIAHVNRLELAPRHNGERMMVLIGNPKHPMPVPEEWHDLDLLLAMTKQYYNRAQNEKAPEAVQMRYREFGDLVLATQKQAAKKMAEEQAAMKPPAPPPGAAPPMDPMTGAPMPGDLMGGGGMPPAGMPPIAA